MANAPSALMRPTSPTAERHVEGAQALDDTWERPIQTLARAYADLRSGVAPWIALNEFFHEWDEYSSERRETLIAEPITLAHVSHQGISRAENSAAWSASADQAGNVHQAGDATDDTDARARDALEQWRWAVFCVAAAEYLCERDGVARPAWIGDPRFTLSEPWYDFGDQGATISPQRRAYLEQVTPELLRRRNVFGGGRVFASKYDFAAGAHSAKRDA